MFFSRQVIYDRWEKVLSGDNIINMAKYTYTEQAFNFKW